MSTSKAETTSSETFRYSFSPFKTSLDSLSLFLSKCIETFSLL